ncbi:hypothetical protein FZEAL_8963 [Fusarium zealandicum]|uniref:Cytochrome P450 monooxygenase n=1 Tax=Fusarium zealandicum TaxID=1053134 RepID=A0A8H4UD65_9HYPO|nr:hypothetical protein FZEAL_8963 [Fusarium zealandicum]
MLSTDMLERVPSGLGLAVFVVFLGVSYVALRMLALPKPLPGIPYNTEAAKSVLGDLPEFRAAPDRREWWAKQAVKHQSPLVQVFLRPFGRPWVFLADHYEASDICMRHLKQFDRSYQTTAVFSGVTPSHHIGMRSNDPRFKKNKELIRDLMSASFLHEVSAPQIHDKVSTLMSLWDRKLHLAKGRPFDASRDIHHTALDIIMAASFGLDSSRSQLSKQLSQLEIRTSPGDTDEKFEFKDVPLREELRFFTVLVDSIGIAVKSPIPRIHHFLYRNLSPKMRRARAGRDKLRNQEIANSVERKKSGRPQRCALDNMLAREDAMAQKEGRDPNYYSETIMDELLGYLVAGHDTTSSSLQWGTTFLTGDQRVQSTLRKALYEAHEQAKEEHRVPTTSEIAKQSVPYLDAVLEEIVRHAQSVAITLRDALVDTQILGVHIPKGTTVGIMANGPSIMLPSVHIDDAKRSKSSQAHMERVHPFDDATITDFIPERWLKSQTNANGDEEMVFDAQNGPIQAFGMGPRACFGKKLAYLELRIFFTMVVWEFELGPLKPELAKREASLSLTRIPKHVYVKLQKTTY